MIFRVIAFVCFGFLWPGILGAQSTVEHVWSRIANNPEGVAGNIRGNAITADAAGNIYTVGTFENGADLDPGPGRVHLQSAGSHDIYFAKYNANGNILFARSVGGTGSDDGLAIAVDVQGNIFITGSFTGTVDFDPGPAVVNLVSSGTSGVFVAKYTSDGTLVWAVADAHGNFTNSFGSRDRGAAIALDPSGSIFITGNTNSQRFFFARISAQGSFEFSHIFPFSDFGSFGTDIGIDGQGNICITGTYSEITDFDPGPGTANLPAEGGLFRAFLAKYTNTGEYIFAKSMGGENDEILAPRMKLDASGNIFLTGTYAGNPDLDPGDGVAEVTPFFTTPIGLDIFLAKYDAQGNFIFVKSIGGTGPDNVLGLTLDASGRPYICGRFFSQTYDTPPDFDPGPGEVRPTPNFTSSEIFMAGYDANGNYLMAKAMGGNGADSAKAITIHNGKIWITGSFTQSADFDPDAGVAGLSTPSNTIQNAFLGSYQMNGTYLSALQLGNYASTLILPDVARAVATDAQGNVYITGTFNGSVDFDEGPGSTILTSAGGADIFFAKYNANGQLQYARSVGGSSTDNVNGLAVDGQGNVYITGSYTGTADFDPGPGQALFPTGSISTTDIYFAKYDSDGNYVFAKRIGNTLGDVGYDIAVDATGNIFMSGTFTGTVDFDPDAGVVNLTSHSTSNFDGFFARYNPDGSFSAAYRIGGAGFEIARKIEIDKDGNIHIGGTLAGGASDFDPGDGVASRTPVNSTNDIFIAKYTSSAGLVYAYVLGNTGSDNLYDLFVSATGSVFITGSFAGSVNFGPGPNTTLLQTPAGTTAIFFAKYGTDGNLSVAKSIGGSGVSASGYGIREDANGDMIVGGFYTGTVDADPATGSVVNMVSNGANDFLIAKYSANGEYKAAASLGGVGSELLQAMELTGDGDVLVTGTLGNVVDMDPGAGFEIKTAINGGDVFVARYSFGSVPPLGPYKTAAPGNWNDPATWEGGKVPPLGAEVIVMHTIIVNVPVTCKTLKVEPGADIQVASGIELKVLE